MFSLSKRLSFLAIFNKKQRMHLIFVAALFLVTAALETAALAVIYPFMTSLLNPAEISASSWFRLVSGVVYLPSEQAYLAAFSVVLICLYLLKGAVLLFVTWLQFRILTGIRCEISKKMFADVLHLPYAVLKQKNSAEIQSILTTDVSNVFNAVSALLSTIQQTIMAVAFVVMLLIIDVRMTCGLAVLLSIGLFLFQRLTGRLTTTAGQRTRTAFIGMMQTAKESMSSLKQLLACRKQQTYEELYNSYTEIHARHERKALFYQRIPRILFETMIMCAVLLYIWRIVITGSDFAVKLPMFITFALTTVKLIPVVSSVAGNANTIRYTEASAERVQGILAECKSNNSRRENKSQPAAAPLRSGVMVDHLTFGYEDGDILLDDVSFQILPKQITGFIGRTGAGKTTLADIILGLYPISRGTILADGHDIFQEPDWWAAHLGYVTQTVMLRDTTVRDSIFLGHSGQKPDDDRIWKCLEEVQLADFIRSLPEGLDTRTGENGIRFSGGQIQRLGIAQALYDNPAFLVMDESTSALDSETEAQVLEALQKLRNSHTILLITHRSSAMEICDVVYQVENGQIRRIK